MKTNAITFKEGKAFAVCEEIPKEPEKGTCSTEPVKDCYKDYEHCLCAKEWKPYREALQRVKDNATEFRPEDHKLMEIALLDYIYGKNPNWPKETLEIKEDTFYPLSVEVDIIEVPEYPTSYAPVKRLARIVEEPEEKPKINTMNKKPDFVTKANIDEAKKYCQEQQLEANGHGQFIYKCGPSEISLSYMLAAYHHDKSVPDSEVEDQEDKAVIDFATWYSGMDREKVINAYKRYLRESITRIKQ